MKKLVLVLLVAMLSVPAFAADPNITFSVTGTTVTVGYTADSADLISGMGLTVQLSSGTIGSFTDLQGDTGKYNIHPCSIVIDGSVVTDYNTPIYSGGNGGTSVVVEYGALYVGDANAPGTAGNLFSFAIVGGTSPVTVTVSANHAGGIVTEGLFAFDIVRTKNVELAPAYPACWNYLTQCKGDSNGDNAVNSTDFLALKGSYGKNLGNAAYNPCADFNRDGAVNSTDFLALKASYGQSPAQTCTTGDINSIY